VHKTPRKKGKKKKCKGQRWEVTTKKRPLQRGDSKREKKQKGKKIKKIGILDFFRHGGKD